MKWNSLDLKEKLLFVNMVFTVCPFFLAQSASEDTCKHTVELSVPPQQKEHSGGPLNEPLLSTDYSSINMDSKLKSLLWVIIIC